MDAIFNPAARRVRRAVHVRPVAAAIGAVLAIAAPTTAHADSYTIVDLGKQMFPARINDAGQIAGGTGMTDKAIEFHAGRWRYLPDAQHEGYAAAINAHGDVAGVQRDSAVLWQRFGRFTALPVPAGSTFSEATSVTGDGRIVGDYQTQEGGPTRCFRTQPGGSAEDLGLPAGATQCFAVAIDAKARIAGTTDSGPQGQVHAFLWEDGTFRDLGTLAGGDVSVALDMNERGEVVGDSTIDGNIDGNGQRHAFLFKGGRMQDIGVSSRFFSSQALGISSPRSGEAEIVGLGYEVDARRSHAVRFDPVLGVVDLDSELTDRAGWHLEVASGVNADGVIVGEGQRADGPHGFMLVPRAGR